jgi:hypothetical protein
VILLKTRISDFELNSRFDLDLGRSKIAENSAKSTSSPIGTVSSFKKRNPISDRGRIISILYEIVNAPERVSDEELIRAVLVVSFMDSDLKNRNPYNWLSQRVIDLAKTRLLNNNLFTRFKINRVRDQEWNRYDELEFVVDQNGKIMLGHGMSLPQ